MTGWDLVILGGIAGVVIFVTYFRRAARQDTEAGERLREDADGVLDRAFSGDQVVTFKTHRNTLDFETVVQGASERGYDLTSATNADQYGTVRDLVFSRR